MSAYLPDHDIRQWMTGVARWSFATMNKRPKLGIGKGGLNDRFRVRLIQWQWVRCLSIQAQ